MLSWDDKLVVLKSAIELLENSIDSFHAKLGSPYFIFEKGKKRFEYTLPTSLHFQFLKAVRVVSGLNAIMYLLEEGYGQEIGVLARTVFDFLDEIKYIQEAHEVGKQTAGQKKIVDDFFASTLKTADELMQNLDKSNRVGKKEIIASITRLLSKFINPDRMSKIQQVLHQVYSGYVHGDYPQIMELYDGHINKFRLRGMLDTPLIEGYRKVFAGLVHRSLNEFGILALGFGISGLKEDIIKKRNEMQDGGVYDPRPKNK